MRKSFLMENMKQAFKAMQEEYSSPWRTIPFLALVFVSMLNIITAKAQLPVVRINTTHQLSREFCDCHFLLDDKGSLDDKISLDADIRFRGATSMLRQKKSFAIKLKELNGEKCDTSLLGMRKDNYWILDAMAIDVARMRNRVSMDLWNDFSRESYVKKSEDNSRNGTDGKFVELYLNDEYWGLYCLSERLDRKQLKLKKCNGDIVKGLLYKSVSWSTLYSTDASYYNYENNSDTWNGWEMSYPNLEDGEPIDWKPLADMIHWLSYSKASEIKESLTSKIDTPVWQDYFLLMEFICAEDNICKNQYVYFYNVAKEDRMLGVSPWDMDHSWGRDYRGRITSNTSADFDLPTTRNRVSDLLYSNEGLLEKTFKDRYAELRATFFDSENLKNRFRTYFSLFIESGAADRERQRWSGADDIDLDFEAEQDYICEWIDNRLLFMDKKYDYSVTGVESVDLDLGLRQSAPATLRMSNVHNISGQSLKNINSGPHTIYIRNGKKYSK